MQDDEYLGDDMDDYIAHQRQTTDLRDYELNTAPLCNVERMAKWMGIDLDNSTGRIARIVRLRRDKDVG